MKVLFVHYGDWFDESKGYGYEHQIKVLTKFLEILGVSVGRSLVLPSRELVEEYDGIIFMSRCFMKEAREIKVHTTKQVFVVTGLVEAGDDWLDVVPLWKAIGWHKVAEKIKASMLPYEIFIRTLESGVANRDQTNWSPLPEIMREAVHAFLDEHPKKKRIFENGDVITVNTFNGLLTQEIKKVERSSQVEMLFPSQKGVEHGKRLV